MRNTNIIPVDFNKKEVIKESPIKNSIKIFNTKMKNILDHMHLVEDNHKNIEMQLAEIFGKTASDVAWLLNDHDDKLLNKSHNILNNGAADDYNLAQAA